FPTCLLALPRDCIAAEKICLMDPACNATYQALENCSLDKTRFLLLSPDARARCRDAKLDLRSSPLLHCKCHRRMRRQKHCLRIYWTVHSRDSANACLKATHFCSLNKKCVHLRTYYASSCTKGAESGGTCDQRKCHKRLRQFFEKVPEDFTKRLLFCPCQDELCGERRRKTIVPECSFQDSIKPNCLLLLDSCIKEHICKSRLADFQQNCQPAGMSPDGCSQHNHAACLKAYMGMIDAYPAVPEQQSPAHLCDIATPDTPATGHFTAILSFYYPHEHPFSGCRHLKPYIPSWFGCLSPDGTFAGYVTNKAFIEATGTLPNSWDLRCPRSQLVVAKLARHPKVRSL
uniref:GDNF family receptor alpha 3 n=1 Tax=Terrapene triunguis TaxID=2587831 RepID=A0A674IS23_9SAUR